ncbi:MAG: HAD-IA family hydrolase [Rudaea sp.]
MPPLAERFRAIAFDLDGTLVDTAPDLAAAANAMLERLGYARLPASDIAALIGHGIDRLVGDALARSTGSRVEPAALSHAAMLFRDYYGERLFVESRVYPGVIDALDALAARDVLTCCITNKPSAFALRLLDAAGLSGRLLFTLCADRPEERKPAPHLIFAACERLAVTPRELLYVGDSRNDIEAARAAGCAVALVDYGYHHGTRLGDLDPDAVVGSLAQLLVTPATRALASSAA